MPPKCEKCGFHHSARHGRCSDRTYGKLELHWQWMNVLADRIDALEQKLSMLEPAPAQKTEGVYVSEGMRVRDDDGKFFTIRPDQNALPHIGAWDDDGGRWTLYTGAGGFAVTYNGKRVLGYAEARP